MNRRQFAKTLAGASGLSLVGAGALAQTKRSRVPMKITDVRTLSVNSYLFVQVHTNKGITGLGESGAWGFLEASAKAVETFRRYLVGQDPLRIEHHWQYLYRSSHFSGSAIMGALSADGHRAVGHRREVLWCALATNCWAESAATRRGSTITSSATLRRSWLQGASTPRSRGLPRSAI